MQAFSGGAWEINKTSVYFIGAWEIDETPACYSSAWKIDKTPACSSGAWEINKPQACSKVRIILVVVERGWALLKSVCVHGWLNHVLVVDKSSLEIKIHQSVVDLAGNVGSWTRFMTDGGSSSSADTGERPWACCTDRFLACFTCLKYWRGRLGN